MPSVLLCVSEFQVGILFYSELHPHPLEGSSLPDTIKRDLSRNKSQAMACSSELK